MGKLHLADRYVCGIYCYILGCYLTVYANEDFEIVRISDKFRDINCDDSDIIDEIIDTNDFYNRKHFRNHLASLMDDDISTNEANNERKYEAAIARLNRKSESGRNGYSFEDIYGALKSRVDTMDSKTTASVTVGNTVGTVSAFATYGILTAAGAAVSVGKSAFKWAQNKLYEKI